jgi:hypothetical protein
VGFSAYERSNFNLYSISNPAELAGTEPQVPQISGGVPLPALLPPSPRPVEPAFNRVSATINDVATGLPTEAEGAQYAVVQYRPRLSLDYLGQPQVGVSGSSGVGGQRGGLYGGIGGIFSDVLARHTVYATIQAQGRIEEIGGSAAYINREHRWNLGIAAQRIPYVAGGYRQGVDQSTGQLITQRITYRLFDTNVSGIAQYPFSQVQRLEFSAGARRIAQDLRTEEFTSGGAFNEELESLPGYNLGEGSAALVYDNSLFGYTSPFAGMRYRFEVAPTIGTLRFTQVTTDFRKYFFLRPLTFAVRGWHFGRYGRDEARLSPIYLGYPQIMRGYSQGSVTNACIDQLNAGVPQTSAVECRALEQLRGSRFAVANAELRFPLIRQVVVGGGLGLPPIEGIAFFDAGTSYGDVLSVNNEVLETRPNFRRGPAPEANDRGLFTSAGVGARVNLFGYAVLEGVYVNALDRPTGWHWQVSLQPGF